MIKAEELAIRKLTPKECWNLMDFNKGAYEKASQVNSRTQLYKQAGNAIVVNCLIGIFGQMIEGHEDDYKVMALDAVKSHTTKVACDFTQSTESEIRLKNGRDKETSNKKE